MSSIKARCFSDSSNFRLPSVAATLPMVESKEQKIALAVCMVGIFNIKDMKSLTVITRERLVCIEERS